MSEYQAAAAPSRRMNGALVLAAAITVVVGTLHIVLGLAVIRKTSYFTAPQNYWYSWSGHFWGWVSLIGGIVLALAGLFLLVRRAWAAYTVICLAGMSAIWNFFLIPFYPLGIILIIALDVLVLWAVSRPGTGLDEWA